MGDPSQRAEPPQVTSSPGVSLLPPGLLCHWFFFTSHLCDQLREARELFIPPSSQSVNKHLHAYDVSGAALGAGDTIVKKRSPCRARHCRQGNKKTEVGLQRGRSKWKGSCRDSTTLCRYQSVKNKQRRGVPAQPSHSIWGSPAGPRFTSSGDRSTTAPERKMLESTKQHPQGLSRRQQRR